MVTRNLSKGTTLPAGLYYVGDLCYIINDKLWSELLDDTGYFGMKDPYTDEGVEPEDNDGYFTFRSFQFFASGTAHGDGTYKDEQGKKYAVDSGTIGAFPLECLPYKSQQDLLAYVLDKKSGVNPKNVWQGEALEYGDAQIVKFDRPFTCTPVHSDEGEGTAMQIGHIRIDTDLYAQDYDNEIEEEARDEMYNG